MLPFKEICSANRVQILDESVYIFLRLDIFFKGIYTNIFAHAIGK